VGGTRLALLRIALSALILLVLSPPRAAAQGPLYARPTDRFGVGLKPDLGAITDYDVASLHIGWYSDWRTRLVPDRPAGIEYAQLVWVHEGTLSPGLDELGTIVDHNPGSLWMIGNEPECILQGNSTPQQYAAAYGQAYALIKACDPTAKVAIGGVVQPTPLRLEWLDRVLEHYQREYGQEMPVDVWNIHVQILQERQGDWGCDIPRGLTETEGRLYGIEDNGNIEVFKQLLWEFRTWMRERGQRAKPLIISEYGVLFPPEYGYTPERVNAFMNASFDFLLSTRDPDLGYPDDENRLVQRWLWYSLNDQPWDLETGEGFNGALFERQDAQQTPALTPVGINFRNYTQALASGQQPAQPTKDSTPTITATVEPPPTSVAPPTPTATRAAAAGRTATAALIPAPTATDTLPVTAALPSPSPPTATPFPTPAGSGNRVQALLRRILEWLRDVLARLSRLLTRRVGHNEPRQAVALPGAQDELRRGRNGLASTCLCPRRWTAKASAIRRGGVQRCKC